MRPRRSIDDYAAYLFDVDGAADDHSADPPEHVLPSVADLGS